VVGRELRDRISTLCLIVFSVVAFTTGEPWHPIPANDADHAQQVPKPPAPTPGVPPGDLPPVPDPAPPPIENPGDAPLSPITDPDVIEPGELNPARTPMRVRGAGHGFNPVGGRRGEKASQHSKTSH
jgi:hypothetical protein